MTDVKSSYRTALRLQRATLVAILLCLGVQNAGADIWQITGNDQQLGAYSGWLETRASGQGEYQVIRQVTLADQTHEDSRAIELIWTGTAQRSSQAAAVCTFTLRRDGFITAAGETTREQDDTSPLQVTATAAIASGIIQSEYTAADDPDFRITETAIYAGPSAAEPGWHSERIVQATHPKPGGLEKLLLFSLFEDYHELPEVAPYTNDPLFEDAVHFQVIDHTDYQYYRDYPDRLRVINQVLNPLSLAETEVVANAFRATLAEKAQTYQDELTDEFVGTTGMVVQSIDASGNVNPDGDSALWTGVYATTQALRYRLAGDAAETAEALANLRHSVQGLLTLMDITGDPLTFARTLRPAQRPVTGDWQEGTGEFAGLDWKPGGNNDMGKGLAAGLLAGWEVLPAADPLRPAISTHAQQLLQLCVFAENPPPACGAKDNQPLIDIPGLEIPNSSFTNPGIAKLLAGVTNDDAALIAAGLDWFREPSRLAFADSGAGIVYRYGLSDWSGNHLGLVTTLTMQRLLNRAGDPELAARWANAAREAWRTLRLVEQPLHAALAARTGLVDPAERQAAADQARWGLRSFPFPKYAYPVDQRWRADFVISPFPAAPWKEDWLDNPGRQQSLVAYPALEQGSDHYVWKRGRFELRADGLGDRRLPGVDYLFLYWLARWGGLITAQD